MFSAKATFKQRLEGREGAMLIVSGRVLQAEGTASVKVLGCAQCVEKATVAGGEPVNGEW